MNRSLACILGTLLIATAVVGLRDDPNPPRARCTCSDIQPRVKYNAPGWGSCQDQRKYGNCNKSFMFNTPSEEAPEGYCQVTCGRCDCCGSIYDVLSKKGGYGMILKAFDLAKMTDVLKNPGTEVTFLAPNDQGVKWGVYDAGYGSIEEWASKNAAHLRSSLQLLLVNPEYGYVPDTTNFFFNDRSLYTQNGAAVKIQRPRGSNFGTGGFRLNGPVNSASITEKDLEACKSVIIPIDKMLVTKN